VKAITNLIASFEAILGSPDKLATFVKYLVIGISVTLLYIGGTTLCVTTLGFPTMPSDIAFYALSTCLSYTANYYWSFRSQANHGKAFTKYITVAVIGLSLNAIFVFILSVVLSVPIWISTTAFSGLWPLVSFVAQKNFVYR